MENDKLLIVDEHYKQRDITKFTGGGMNAGEGSIECLQREIREEMHMKVGVIEHFYTTDFFQQSAFREDEQILSIYYIIRRRHPEQPINHNWQEMANEHKIKFRWIATKDLDQNMFTFPIDKKVIEMIVAKTKV